MFSRNRSGGAHGAPKGGTKTKKRAPNPKVALTIRGKIHRLLQGSVDHHVPDPQHYYEEEVKQEKCAKRHELCPKTASKDEACSSVVMSNGKGHAGPPGPLTLEGCLRIPCTPQRKSGKSPANRKRISFEGLLPLSPEMPPTTVPLSGSARQDRNGLSITSPRARPKRPYSAGDTLDYDFTPPFPGPPEPEEEEGRLGEADSSAIIDHILKELRGINKIQEEISDLRDYLTSVKGSVEEVSSCVDAVLLEIEGIRSSGNRKPGLGAQASTWSGKVRTDGPSARRRPASAHGSLESAATRYNRFPDVRKGELRQPRAKNYSVSPMAESTSPLDPEDLEDTSDLSSDIPEGARAGKLSFGQDCLSTTSLSSPSSKSESDVERTAEQAKDHWATATLPHEAAAERLWDREPSYLRDYKSEAPYDGAVVWDHYVARISSDHGLGGSRQHYSQSPVRTSSRREDWQTRRSKSQPGFQTSLRNYNAEYSYPKSSAYHSFDGHYGYANGFDSVQSISQVGSYDGTYFPYEDSTAGTWTSQVKPFVPETDETLLQLGQKDPQRGYNVRRISRAVSDFSSALREALCKLEVPPDQEDVTDFNASTLSDMPPKSFSWDLVSQTIPFEEAQEEGFFSTSQHYPSLELVAYPASMSNNVPMYHADVPEEWPLDRNVRSQLSQGTTTESLSIAEAEEQGENVEVKSAVQAEEQNLEINQMDERTLKCVRSFQQILREKREMRRTLASVSTSSREGFEAGSPEPKNILSSSHASTKTEFQMFSGGKGPFFIRWRRPPVAQSQMRPTSAQNFSSSVLFKFQSTFGANIIMTSSVLSSALKPRFSSSP
ncbi:uncharacterized protein LOC133154397 isoform X1 [Syngnathus typhle]|uniref:uncharacterized protein LOC133154397 isoform X1 n=1 Tax=Syngnathus typhle TaxID=161592 RepID=UPI002A6B220A|nr:uncharacterized protein LOC133154397 isoform X1 [Syngnathus typhle]